MLATDDKNLLYSTIWRSAAELNSIIQHVLRGNDIKFYDGKFLKEFILNKSKDSPSKFIECIWEFENCEIEGQKIRLYFSHKLLALSCYTVDEDLNIVGIREVFTFSAQGVMAAYEDLCKRGITIKELMDRNFEELMTFQKKQDEG